MRVLNISVRTSRGPHLNVTITERIKLQTYNQDRCTDVINNGITPQRHHRDWSVEETRNGIAHKRHRWGVSSDVIRNRITSERHHRGWGVEDVRRVDVSIVMYGRYLQIPEVEGLPSATVLRDVDPGDLSVDPVGFMYRGLTHFVFGLHQDPSLETPGYPYDPGRDFYKTGVPGS